MGNINPNRIKDAGHGWSCKDELVCVCVCVCVYAYVCVREREREKASKREKEREGREKKSGIFMLSA